MIIAHWVVPEVRQDGIANEAATVTSCGARWGGTADKTALCTGNAGYWWKCLQRAVILLSLGAQCRYDVAIFPLHLEQAVLDVVKK